MQGHAYVLVRQANPRGRADAATLGKVRMMSRKAEADGLERRKVLRRKGRSSKNEARNTLHGVQIQSLIELYEPPPTKAMIANEPLVPTSP